MISTEKLLKNNPSIYKLVNMAAWRALQLDRAEEESTAQKDSLSVLDIALNEIIDGSLSCKEK